MTHLSPGFISRSKALLSGLRMSFDILWQGNIPDPTATPPVVQFPYRGQPGSSQPIETTLTSLPDYQSGETVTGSVNGFTATVAGISSEGTSELATCVGGGQGNNPGSTGWGGGSGGGGGSNNWGSTAASSSVAGQGNNGGPGGDRNGFSGAGGGGGGAGSAGGGGGGNSGGAGGNGRNNNYSTGANVTYGGGGGSTGGNNCPSGFASGGTGGGGSNGPGGVNLGGGGGTGNSVANGGSGIVVTRYDTSQSGFSLSGGTIRNYTSGSINYQSNTFLSSGTLVVTGSGDMDSLILSGGGGAGLHGCTGGVEGGWFYGAGGAGGMLETTGTAMVDGSYAVQVGAGGTGSAPSGTGVGNLSWITPRRILSLSGASGDFVVGETLTGGTSGATGDVLELSP